MTGQEQPPSLGFAECGPADLLFYAEQVRDLGNVPADEVAAVADLHARYMEHHARCMLAADIRRVTS